MPYYPTTSKTDRYEIVCQLPLTSELFCQAIHPNEPVVAVGMSSGHVQSFRLPSDEDNEGDDSDDDSTGGRGSVGGSTLGAIETQWKTRRHKGSCRSLGYSLDGESKFLLQINRMLPNDSNTLGEMANIPSSALLCRHRQPSQSLRLLHRQSNFQNNRPLPKRQRGLPHPPPRPHSTNSALGLRLLSPPPL